jgi:hypothetical protein
MYASCSIPHMIPNHILHPKHMVISNGWFPLPQILTLSQHILANSFLVFHSFLHNHSFWKSTRKPLIMYTHCSPIKYLFLSISESMTRVINIYLFPIVVSVFLLSWTEIAMCFLVHLGYFLLFFLVSTYWIQNILGILRRDGGNTKCKLLNTAISILVYLIWPLVLPLITLSKWFFHHTSIFSFFYIIKFISQSIHILCLYHLIHMLRSM